MRRKLLYIEILFISGIFVSGCFFSASDKRDVLILISAMIIGFIAFFHLSEFRWTHVLVFVVGFFLMAFFLHGFEKYEVNKYVGDEVEIEAEIISVKQREKKKQYTFNIDKIGEYEGDKILQNKFIIVDRMNLIDIDDPIGAAVILTGILEIPQSSANPRGFDYRKYLYSEGVAFTCNSFEIIQVTESTNVNNKLKNTVLHLKSRYLNHLSAKGYALADGILFGNSSGIDEGVLESFQKNGTAHVLAVSGLHIGIIYGVYDFIQKKIRNKLFTVIFVLFLYLYGVITMWPVSVCRAQLLVVLKLIADRIERPFDLTTSLGFIAGLVCIKNPLSIYSLSFQMSFLTVFILSSMQRAIERITGKHLNGGIVIQLAMIPYMIYVFNYMSIVGVLVNIPVILMISIYVPIGVTTFLFFSFTGVFPSILIRVLEGLGNMVSKLNEFFYVEGITSKDITSGPLIVIVIFYMILFFAVSEQITIEFIRRKYRQLFLRGIVVIMIGTMGVAVANSPFDEADMVFLDVGHGDALHIKYKDFDVLIDGGGSEKDNIAKKVVKPYLLKNGVKNIELVMGTSLNEEHYLGLVQLKNCFDVKESKIWCEAGEKIEGMSEGFIEVLWPLNADVKNFDGKKNGNVFKIYFEGVTCLISGDLSKEGERELVKYYKHSDKLKSDILKVSNHGNSNSSCDEFIEAVSPKVAIISAGDNKLQKPSDEVIEKILKKDIILYMIDSVGAVGVDVNGENFTVCTMQKSMISKNLTRG